SSDGDIALPQGQGVRTYPPRLDIQATGKQIGAGKRQCACALVTYRTIAVDITRMRMVTAVLEGQERLYLDIARHSAGRPAVAQLQAASVADGRAAFVSVIRRQHQSTVASGGQAACAGDGSGKRKALVGLGQMNPSMLLT